MCHRIAGIGPGDALVAKYDGVRSIDGTDEIVICQRTSWSNPKKRTISVLASGPWGSV